MTMEQFEQEIAARDWDYYCEENTMNTDCVGTIEHLCRNFPDLAKALRRCDQEARAAHKQGNTGWAGQFREWKSNGITLLCTDYHLTVILLDTVVLRDDGTLESGPEYGLSLDPYNNHWDDPLLPRPVGEGEWGAGVLPTWVTQNNTPEGPKPVR